MTEEEERKKLEDFLNLNLMDYTYDVYFGKSRSIKPTLIRLDEKVKSILDKTIDIYLKSKNNKDDDVINLLINDVNTIFKYIKNIQDFTSNENPSNVDEFIRKISDQINSTINSFYNNSDGQNKLIKYIVYQQIYSDDKIDFSEVDKKKNEVDAVLAEIKILNSDANKILNDLRNSASSVSTIEYSKIFESEANNYSTNKFKFSLSGIAEKWLIIGIILLVFFILDIFLMHVYYPVYDLNSITNTPQINIGNLIFKITTFVVFIFLIRFTFKQYIINKHLYTLNKHRANVLNSFNLFLNTIDREDSTTRHALMMEVSKAIYESGKTGYLDSKSDEVSNPSIIEITKLLNNKS